MVEADSRTSLCKPNPVRSIEQNFESLVGPTSVARSAVAGVYEFNMSRQVRQVTGIARTSQWI